jgi:hypothetical protein
MPNLYITCYIDRRQQEKEATNEEAQVVTGRLSTLIAHKQQTIGHFLPNKQMIFDPTQDSIVPESTGDHNRAPRLVDLSVLKKAGIYSTRHDSNGRRGSENAGGGGNTSVHN